MKKDITAEIEERLFAEQDEKYRLFHSSLMPGVPSESVIGVRTPAVRALAREFAKRGDIGDFLASLPHRYYEENNLHGVLIAGEKDYCRAVEYVDAFLPYVDNWATCDMLSPKVFAKNRDRLICDIERWLASDRPFTVRFGIEMLMSHYLDGDFRPEYPEKVCRIKSGDYYVRMMIAWYFATALAKQWDAVLPYIENFRLEKWTHNRTIQKARESFRVPDERKKHLEGYRLK